MNLIKRGILFLLVTGGFNSVYSQNPIENVFNDTIHEKSGITSVPNSVLGIMPFRYTGEAMLTAPNTYFLKGRDYQVDGIKAEGNYMFIDGMQILNGKRFLYHSIQKLNYYRTNQPINIGNIPGTAVEITTRSFNDRLHIEGDVLTDVEKYYNNQLYEVLIGGPVSFRKKSERKWKKHPTFLISGSFEGTNDYSPSSEQKFVTTQQYRQYIANKPLTPDNSGSGTFLTSEFAMPGDFQTVNIHQNAGRKSQNIFAKFEIPVRSNMNLSVGSYFSNDYGNEFNFKNSLFNSENNLYSVYRSFDNYISFTHSFINNDKLKANYKIFFQYSDYFFKRENEKFKDNWFEYGYIGKFTSYKTPTFELGSISVDSIFYDNVQILNSWDYDTAFIFENTGYNDLAAMFNENVYSYFGEDNINNRTQLVTSGGLINGMAPPNVYSGLWKSKGAIYDNPLGEVNRDKYRGIFQLNINTGVHKISTGFEYSKLVERYYSLKPNALWVAARSFTNLHLLELDKDNPYIINDTVFFPRKYQVNEQMTFDINLRKKLGLPVDGTDYILIDSYDMAANTISYYDENGNLKTITTPDNLLSLDMFGDRDFAERGTVRHKGYTLDGNNYNSSNPYSYYNNGSMNPFTPVYSGTFIQDEFGYGDLSVRVGIRMDYYNANQPVMKDKYLLYEAYTKGEINEVGGNPVTFPSNIDDDWIVYVDDARNPSAITGYRDGDTWYNSYGRTIDDPFKYLDVGAGVSPYLKNPNIKFLGKTWRPEMTFTDYKPVYSFLPQINLNYSFLKMNIYANYNSFTKNPYYMNVFMPDDYIVNYYYSNRYTNNPALKPYRINKINVGGNYEVLKGILTDFSFQKMIVSDYFITKTIIGAYPHNYITLVNRDENVKINSITGSIALLPEIKGFSGSVSVTKSFIDSLDRTIINIADFVANANINYNFGYGSGFRFPGHKTLKNIFEGFNIGLYYQYRTGTYLPDVAKLDLNIQQIRNYNYSPDFSFFNLRIEKGFYIKAASLNLGVYCWVENLFNRQNLYFVNPATGKVDDDGFLSSPEWQYVIENQVNPESFRYLYQQSLKNPNYYGKPRIIRIGLNAKF